MNAIIYLEGGGDSKELHARCREGFRKLLLNCGFERRMPRLVASGGRDAAFEDFKRARETKSLDYVAMLIDSEEPITNIEATWKHLENVKTVTPWEKPNETRDEQVLFMTTCMETWIVADKKALSEHYGSNLQGSALPPLEALENHTRHEIQDKLSHATRNCSNPYKKGKRSFQILARLNPVALAQYLPSFKRAYNILDKKLLYIQTPAKRASKS